MTLEIKEVRTTLSVVCDRCQTRGPDSQSPDEAIQQVFEEGWQRLSRWNGFVHVYTDLCPDCYKEWGAEQSQGWQDAKAAQTVEEVVK